MKISTSSFLRRRKFHPKFEEDSGTNPQLWANGDAFITHWMNAYTMTIPEGEKFNVESVQAFLDQISDKKLEQQASGFIAQELSHGRAHEKFLSLLTRYGYSSRIFSALYNFSYKIMKPISTPLMRLAFVVTVERINEIIGETALKHGTLEGAPEDYALLYKWHFAEEIEHKALVFDVYQHVSGNRFLLGYTMILCLILNTSFLMLGTFLLSIQDKTILNLSSWKRGFQYFFTREKFLLKVTKGCFELLKKDFHPSQSDNLHYAEDILRQREIGQSS